MSKSFLILRVSWLTQTPGNEHRRDEIVSHVFHVIDFLQKNGLATRQLIEGIDNIQDDFELSSADLTDEGLEVMKSGYDKWLSKVDKGMNPADTSLLDKTLQKVRSRGT